MVSAAVVTKVPMATKVLRAKTHRMVHKDSMVPKDPLVPTVHRDIKDSREFRVLRVPKAKMTTTRREPFTDLLRMGLKVRLRWA